VAARAVLLFVLLRNLPIVRRPLWLLLLGVFVVLDLGMLLPELAPRVPSAYYREPPLVARQFPADRASARLFHLASWQTGSVPAYFTPQRDLYWIHRNAMYPPMPATWGIRTAIDVDYDLTALVPTADFTEAMWGLRRKREDWVDVAASMSNVSHMALFVDPRTAYARANEERTVLQPVRILPTGTYPRYYFATKLETINGTEDFVAKLAGGGGAEPVAFIGGPAFAPARGIVRNVRETASTVRLEVETAGRAFLVMSVTPQKYWQITVDGAEAPAVVTNVGYQGVVIPTAGAHVVEMRYRNPLLAAGGAVSVATLLALGLLARRRW
jgi:hypothetical protein